MRAPAIRDPRESCIILRSSVPNAVHHWLTNKSHPRGRGGGNQKEKKEKKPKATIARKVSPERSRHGTGTHPPRPLVPSCRRRIHPRDAGTRFALSSLARGIEGYKLAPSCLFSPLKSGKGLVGSQSLDPRNPAGFLVVAKDVKKNEESRPNVRNRLLPPPGKLESSPPNPLQPYRNGVLRVDRVRYMQSCRQYGGGQSSQSPGMPCRAVSRTLRPYITESPKSRTLFPSNHELSVPGQSLRLSVRLSSELQLTSCQALQTFRVGPMIPPTGHLHLPLSEFLNSNQTVKSGSRRDERVEGERAKRMHRRNDNQIPSAPSSPTLSTAMTPSPNPRQRTIVTSSKPHKPTSNHMANGDLLNA